MPNANFGRPLDPKNQGHASTTAWVKNLFDGNINAVKDTPPQYFVDVRDTALLHLVAMVNPKVQHERIFAFAAPYNFNDILGILRKQYPQRNFPQDITGLESDLSIIEPAEEAERLLKEIKGSGWTSLAEAVKENVADLI